MYKCNRCGAIFDDPDYKEICAEDYYGVSSMFENYNYIGIEICSECGSEDFEDYYGED